MEDKPVLDWLMDQALLAVKRNAREINSLDLSCIILSHEYVKELADALSTNNQLKVLKMSNTKLGDVSLKVVLSIHSICYEKWRSATCSNRDTTSIAQYYINLELW